MIADTASSIPRGAGKLKPVTPKVPRTRITGRGQVQRAWDETPGEHVYHASPEENFSGIQEQGLMARLKKGFSAGVHFSPEPDYPVIGDRPMNYYRARRGDVSDLEYRSSGDVHTPRDVAPEHLEVYTGTAETGPRWTALKNAYEAASVPLMLAALANSVSGTLGGPSIQTPLDAALGQTIESTRRAAGMDVYDRPGQHWSEQVPTYSRMGHSVHGRVRPRRYTQTIQHQAPPGTELL